MGEVYILAAALQLAVFLAILILSCLMEKDKAAKIIRVIAFLFVISSFTRLIHVFAEIYPKMWPWLALNKNLFLITHPILFINGLLLFILLIRLEKDK